MSFRIVAKWNGLPPDESGLLPRELLFYDVPIVVGAKRGFPNFNEFALQTVVQVSRKLEFRKNNVNDVTPSETNQMFMLGVSNVFGLEAWNSYSNVYPRGLQVLYAYSSTTLLTNNAGVRDRRTFPINNFMNPLLLAANQWGGRGRSNDFQVPRSMSRSRFRTQSIMFCPTRTLKTLASRTGLSGTWAFTPTSGG